MDKHVRAWLESRDSTFLTMRTFGAASLVNYLSKSSSLRNGYDFTDLSPSMI